jgi:hypothetical protein
MPPTTDTLTIAGMIATISRPAGYGLVMACTRKSRCSNNAFPIVPHREWIDRLLMSSESQTEIATQVQEIAMTVPGIAMTARGIGMKAPTIV